MTKSGRAKSTLRLNAFAIETILALVCARIFQNKCSKVVVSGNKLLPRNGDKDDKEMMGQEEEGVFDITFCM